MGILNYVDNIFLTASKAMWGALTGTTCETFIEDFGWAIWMDESSAHMNFATEKPRQSHLKSKDNNEERRKHSPFFVKD